MKSVSAIIHVRFDYDEDDLEALKAEAVTNGTPFNSENDALYSLALRKIEVTGAHLRDVEVNFNSIK